MSPYKNPADQRECNRRYYWRNQQKISTHRRVKRQENKEKIRLSTLGISIPGKGNKTIYGLKKRPRPEYCELCGKRNEHLLYHHWDDSDYNKGMWICRGICHQIAEAVEKGKVDHYNRLKAVIEQEMILRAK